LRILLLTHRLTYAPNRGDRIGAYHLIRLLTRRHQVRLVSLIHDAREASHLGDMRQLGVEAAGAPIPKLRNWLKAVGLPGTDTPSTHLLLSSPALPGMLARESDEHPDVVVADGPG
jgi:hypothetical protein